MIEMTAAMSDSSEWVVTASYAIDPPLDVMDEWSEQFDASVSRVPDRGVVDVTVYAPGDLHPIDVLAKFIDPINDVISAELAGVEIAEELGITRQRVHQLRSTEAFPAPLAELRGGAVWDAAAVRKFAQDWERKPGRPRGDKQRDYGLAEGR